MQGPLPTAEGLAAADFNIQSNDFVSQVARFLFFETLHSCMNIVVIVGASLGVRQSAQDFLQLGFGLRIVQGGRSGI
jgi:hypothetical protein